MSNMFVEIGRKAVANSPVREGRESISTEEILNKYPDGITITQFDVLSKRNGTEMVTFPTFTFAEEPTKYYNGGMSLSKVVNGWLAHFDGDIEAANAALKASGGCRIKLISERSESGTPKGVPIFV